MRSARGRCAVRRRWHRSAFKKNSSGEIYGHPDASRTPAAAAGPRQRTRRYERRRRRRRHSSPAREGRARARASWAGARRRRSRAPRTTPRRPGAGSRARREPAVVDASASANDAASRSSSKKSSSSSSGGAGASKARTKGAKLLRASEIGEALAVLEEGLDESPHDSVALHALIARLPRREPRLGGPRRTTSSPRSTTRATR